jgi:hypothetical protein
MAKRYVRHMLRSIVAAAMLLPATLARAGEPTAVGARATTEASTAAPNPSAVFDDLKQASDATLESQRAGYRHYHHWHEGHGGGAYVLTVILLIIFFPIGLIVLIVLICTD